MAKKNVMVSMDEELHTLAKEKHINISNMANEALRERLRTDISDVEHGQILLRCSLCEAVNDFAYICPRSKQIWCEKCEKSDKYCPKAILEKREKNGSRYHEHIRLPNLKGEFNQKLYKEATMEQYRVDNQ